MLVSSGSLINPFASEHVRMYCDLICVRPVQAKLQEGGHISAGGAKGGDLRH
jgi:hypothetical protein